MWGKGGLKMGKKMIFHVICAIVGALIYYLFFEDALLIDIIVFVSVYLLFSLIIEFVLSRSRSNRRNKNQGATADHDQIEGFIEAIGGRNNIVKTDFEASRVKIELVNVSLIDPDKLKEYALDGAYLAGSQLQLTVGSSFGSSPGEFSNEIRKAIE